jgi:hypothetical protein
MWSHSETNNHLVALTATSDVKSSPERRFACCMQFIAFGKLRFQDIESPPDSRSDTIEQISWASGARWDDERGCRCSRRGIPERYRSDIGSLVDNVAVIVGWFDPWSDESFFRA